MKKALILTAIIALTTTTALAADTAQAEKTNCTKCPLAGKMPPKDMHKRGPGADFEKRLNLTDAQKAKIKKQREADRKKMEPLRKQIAEKQRAKFEIFKKYEETDKDLIKLNEEIKVLKDKEHKIMEENRKSFESILTKDQKAELEKIKEEHKKDFEGQKGPKHPKFDKPCDKANCDKKDK